MITTVASIAGIVWLVLVVGYISRAMATDPMHLPRGSYWPPEHVEDFTNFLKMFSPLPRHTMVKTPEKNTTLS
jgi:hypothetical protein